MWTSSAIPYISLFCLQQAHTIITICSFQLFENGHIHNVVSMLIKVVKLDVDSNSTV